MGLDNDLFAGFTVSTPKAQHRFDLARCIANAVWVFDIDTSKIVMANSAAVNLWHADSEAELCQRDLSNGMSKTVRDRLRQYKEDFQSGSTFNELWTLYPKGVPTSTMILFGGYVLDDGRMAMICQALSHGNDTPENIRSAEALLYTDVMITLYDEDGISLYSNPAARDAIKEINTRFRDHFVDPEEHDDILHVVASRGDIRAVTQMHTSWGTSWHDLSIKKCIDAATGDPAFLVTAVDVTDLKTARDKARYLADCDQLTGCFNRAYFNRQLDNIHFERGPANRGILCLDLDRFKHFNDAFGHEGGDNVLCAVAERVQECLGRHDILARFGGDEFVILLETVKDQHDLMEQASKIRAVINQPVSFNSSRMLTTSSIGAALLPQDHEKWTDCMKQADIALYAAKEAGRDCCLLFDDAMGQAAQERQEIEIDLKVALQQDQFILHYQPRVDTQTQQVTSVEALVRWQHPTKGMIPPNAFIPICEETGMIEELGYFVMRKGCQQLIEWRAQGLDISMSVNVSPRQFLDENLIGLMKELAADPDFPKDQLELEITENVLIGDHELIALKLKQITNMGFRIAIDDFGTGYSNLAYISKFPLNCIKIDKSFIDQLPASQPIISLVQTLANQIGACTVAEGVETREQANYLTAIGCHQIQGYFYARPTSKTQIKSIITRIASMPKLMQKT